MRLPYIIKFRLLPKLQRSQIYRLLRDAVVRSVRSFTLMAMSPLHHDLLSILSY
jgi:hypothetical protein